MPHDALSAQMVEWRKQRVSWRRRGSEIVHAYVSESSHTVCGRSIVSTCAATKRDCGMYCPYCRSRVNRWRKVAVHITRPPFGISVGDRVVWCPGDFRLLGMVLALSPPYALFADGGASSSDAWTGLVRLDNGRELRMRLSRLTRTASQAIANAVRSG